MDPVPRYTFSAEVEPGYLHVRVSGRNTPETVARYVRETVKACATHGRHQVLVEEDLAGPSLRQMQMFDLIEAGAGRGGPPLTIAYVDVNPEHDIGLLRFAETAARNRGLLLHLFRTVEEAEAWLRSREAPAEDADGPAH
jgi:hypothetical protein